MCFPSKRQKNNLSDDNPKNPAPEPIKTQEPAVAQLSTVPASPPPAAEPTPAPAPVTDIAPATEMAPKVAIIIYSMYGHIAKRASPHYVSPFRR